MSDTRPLLTGLAYVESARWHDGRLWFCHWGTGEVVAVDLAGNREVIAVPHDTKTLGYSIDWLPDGRLLVTGQQVRRMEADGSLVTHADLSGITGYGWNEIVVDGRGNVYVNSINFGFTTGDDFTVSADFAPGVIALITPDGTVRTVADGMAFPNGMVVTPDNSTLIVAESFAGRLTAFDIAADGGLSNRRVWADITGDGICLDADGCVWTQVSDPDGTNAACVRVREGGEVLQRYDVDRGCFACTLGGPAGRTLFLLVAEWRGVEKIDEALADRTGRVLVADAPAPHAGWP